MNPEHYNPQPITYALLNGFETSILSARPLMESEVCRLYKSTLSRFLINNGVQCDSRCAKSFLIDLVFQLAADHEYAEARSYTPPPAPSSAYMWEPMSSGSFNTDNTPGQRPCTCHECQGMPPPFPRHNQHEPERSETPDSEASNVSDSLYVIEPCNALLNPDELDVEEDIEDCVCDVPVEQLLKRVNLSPDSKRMFRSVADSSTPEIILFLQNYGVEVAGSGCRIHLLLMLRDLLEEQSNAMPADNAGAALLDEPTTSSGLASVVTQHVSQSLAEYLQVFGGALRDALQKREEVQTKEAEAVKEKDSTDEGDPAQECCICLQNQRNIAFVPCGHTLCCGVCAKKLKECPVCRKKILRRLRIFFS